MSKSVAFEIVRDLYQKNRIFCSSDYDASLDYINKLLPLHIHSYKEPFNGWVIPPKWDLVEAVICHQGQTIFKVENPLQIIGLSSPFQGKVDLEELRKHLHYDRRDPHSTPYHFRQHYRPWEREWGFCVSQQFYDNLQEGEYEVSIVTKESEGILKVAEHTKQGEHPENFCLCSPLRSSWDGKR